MSITMFFKCFILRSDESEPQTIAINMTERFVQEKFSIKHL